MTSDFEAGKKLAELFRGVGVCTMRACCLEAIAETSARSLHQLPQFWQGWLTKYVEQDGRVPNSADKAFFRTARKLGFGLQQTQDTCPVCKGKGTVDCGRWTKGGWSSGPSTCYNCKGKGKASVWVLA